MKYTNQKEVDALQSYLYGIDSGLELTAFSTRHGSGENTAISAGLYIAEKGNRPIIQRLLRDGFRKVIRQKISTGIGSDFYMVHLEHPLEGKPDRMSDGTDGLLQHGLCPYEYQCFTSDCMECVKIRSGELTKK